MKKHHFIFILISGILLSSCGSPKKIQGYELFEYTGDASYKSPYDTNQENAENQSSNLENLNMCTYNYSIAKLLYLEMYKNGKKKYGGYNMLVREPLIKGDKVIVIKMKGRAWVYKAN